MLVVLIVAGIGVIINFTHYLISKKTSDLSSFIGIICLTVFLCSAFSLAVDSPTEYLKATIEVDSKPKSIKIADIRTECSNCGNKLWASENKYCSECGNEVLNNKFFAVIYYCPFCKELTTTSKNYCENCGHNMMEINSQLKQKDVNIKKR